MLRTSPLLLLLAACATADDLGPAEFGTGSPEELARAEDLAYAALFDVDGAAARGGIDELRTIRVRVDDLAMAHTHVQQLQDGVPVWGAEAIVHLHPDGSLASVTNDLVGIPQVDTAPAYAADEAIEMAVELHAGGWDDLSGDPTADLWVLPRPEGDHLAWRVTVPKATGGPADRIDVLFVDAHDASLLWRYDNLQTATCSGATNYYGTVSVDCYTDGTSWYLEDTTDKLGTFTWNNTTTGLYYASSTSTTFGTTTVSRNALEAHYVSQAVYDYYAAAHGRNGIDGAGGPAGVTTHGVGYITSTTSYSRDYVNASWDPTALRMTYGDGDGVNASSLTTLDVGGHEFAHGVTQYEANLTYSGESGHLNESFSDVFGAMVERSRLGESIDTWAIGEEAWTPSVAGDALRYMDDPAADGYSYDYYTSGIGSVDVHYGSGVPNLAFYLLSEGGTHPRGKSTTVVTGIGADAAADIWYLALANYMTSSTSFSGARTATLSAAAALYGTSSVEYTQVGNAWTAVGVGGSSGSSCTTTNYSGSLSRSGRTVYAPSSSGTSVTGTSQTVSLVGPSSANFDLYLQKASGRSWSTVKSSTGSTATESITYSGTSGTYRVAVYSTSGSGSFTLAWCR